MLKWTMANGGRNQRENKINSPARQIFDTFKPSRPKIEERIDEHEAQTP